MAGRFRGSEILCCFATFWSDGRRGDDGGLPLGKNLGLVRLNDFRGLGNSSYKV